MKHIPAPRFWQASDVVARMHQLLGVLLGSRLTACLPSIEATRQSAAAPLPPAYWSSAKEPWPSHRKPRGHSSESRTSKTMALSLRLSVWRGPVNRMKPGKWPTH